MTRRICIECLHYIDRPSPTQKLHKRCAKLRNTRASCERNRTTTTGRNGDRLSEFAAKGQDAPRPKRKEHFTASDILHSAPEISARIIDRILAGESTLS